MQEESVISKYFFGSFETFLSKLSTGEITQDLLNILALLALLLWIYFGYRMYADAKVRFRASLSLSIVFLLVGIITGPIGLLIYSFSKPKYTQEELEFIKIEHKFYYHQASKVKDCTNCQAYVLEGHEFCTNCGVQNRVHCESCNALTDMSDSFCFSCGNKLNNSAQHTHNTQTTEEKFKHAVEVIDEEAQSTNNKTKSNSVKKGLKLAVINTKNSLIKVLDFGNNIRSTISNKVKKAEVVDEKTIATTDVPKPGTDQNISIEESKEEKNYTFKGKKNKKNKKKFSKNKLHSTKPNI